MKTLDTMHGATSEEAVEDWKRVEFIQEEIDDKAEDRPTQDAWSEDVRRLETPQANPIIKGLGRQVEKDKLRFSGIDADPKYRRGN